MAIFSRAIARRGGIWSTFKALPRVTPHSYTMLKG